VISPGLAVPASLFPPVYPPELLDPEPPPDPDPLVEPDPDEDPEDPDPDEDPKPEEDPELVIEPAPEEPPEDPEVDSGPESDPLEASSWPEAPTDAFDPQAAPPTAAAVNPRATSPRERSSMLVRSGNRALVPSVKVWLHRRRGSGRVDAAESSSTVEMGGNH